jgi:hypothetical protein
MYSPHLQHELWLLAKLKKRPMSKVLRAILKEYFDAHQQDLATAEAVTSTERITLATIPTEASDMDGSQGMYTPAQAV